jgi:voltage-gated potassium channel
MPRKRYEERTPAVGRRAVAVSVLRALASVVVLVAVYYRLPRGFATGLLAFGAALTWHVRAILRSTNPQLRAIQAVAVGLPALLLVFTSTYFVIAGDAPRSFSEEISQTDGADFGSR